MFERCYVRLERLNPRGCCRETILPIAIIPFQMAGVAETRGIRWIGTDINFEYIIGGAIRFPPAMIHQFGLRT